jgi:hypothetical protein
LVSAPAPLAAPPLRFSMKLAGLALLLGLLIENTAELNQRGLAQFLGLSTATVAAALLAVLAVAWARFALRAPAGAEAEIGRWERLGARVLPFLPALALLDTLLIYPPTKNATWTLAWSAFFIAALVALVLAAALPVRRQVVWMVALVAGLGLRLFVLRPHDQLTGDMQLLVHSASGDLLAGKAPYHWYYLPWAVPLTYWPGTLLAYLPGRALGLHPRVTNLVAEAALTALAVLAARGAADPRARSQHPALLLVATACLLQGPIEWFRGTAQVPGWLFLGMALLATVRRHRAAGVAWGLALAASPFAAPFFPLAVIATIKERGTRAALVLFGQAAGVAAVLILPFVVWSPL